MAKRKTLRPSSNLRLKGKLEQVLKGRLVNVREEIVKEIADTASDEWNRKFSDYHAMWVEFKTKISGIKLPSGVLAGIKAALNKCYKDGVMGADVAKCVDYMASERVYIPDNVKRILVEYLKAKVSPAGAGGAGAGAGAGGLGTLTP